MHYTVNTQYPTAHITKQKSRLKIYDEKIIFLKDKDNFEFELYNSKTSSVLCKIKLNGNYISNTGIVLRPGQRVFLERFLDTNNKFEFSTYEVDNTLQNRSAIDLNGDVLIEFYNEQEARIYPHLSGGNWGSGWTTINTGSAYYGNMTFTTNSTNIVGTNPSSFYSSTSTPTGSNIRSKFDTSSTLLRGPKKKGKSIETGRVEKGEQSNQTFTNSYEQFYYHTSHTIKFKIQPASTKNINVEEIRQYCTECGTKMKSNYKFCPSCGNKL